MGPGQIWGCGWSSYLGILSSTATQVLTDALSLSGAPTYLFSLENTWSYPPANPPSLMSAVATGQLTGHFHIQFGGVTAATP